MTHRVNISNGQAFVPSAIFLLINSSLFWMSVICGNTSPLVFKSVLRRIFSPENVLSVDRYDYPTFLCEQRQDCPSSLIQAVGSTRGPGLFLWPPLKTGEPEIYYPAFTNGDKLQCVDGSWSGN